MGSFVRSATASGRRACFPSWRRLIFAVAFLAAATTALVAFTAPSISSSVDVDAVDSRNSSSSSFPSSVREFVVSAHPLSSSPSSNLLNSTLVVQKSDAKEVKSSDNPPPKTSSSAIQEIVVSAHPLSSQSSNLLNSTPMVEKSDAKVVKSGKDQQKRPFWMLPPDEAIIYAIKEIENAPLVMEDVDLYAPLFRNLSVFKRSYELMERILKVYIYKDGNMPIFHTPELKGIYASEGWFMKLMQEDRKFVVRDPSKAHLFYLPYSSRQLELALYVPNSHNLRPLSIFLKDYVNNISSKYPFWNRTRGADHFLVACHDWGPYTTTAHEDLRKNTIKALCNADASEGIFVRGRDVSLPETTIRTPSRPLRYVGGKRVSQRTILAFFAGNMHGRVRPTLIKYWGNKEDEMRIYKRLPNRVSKKMSYVEHMRSSKFCICPMGYEVNSPRIVEAIYSECVPVIIADNFVLPFEEVLDWSSFSLVVAEKDIPNLKDILLGISQKRYLSLQTAVKRLQRHFLWHKRPEKYDLFHMILHSIWFSRLKQIET